MIIPGLLGTILCGLDAVVEVTLSSGSTGLDLSTQFTTGDWTGPALKRVRIPADVTRGSNNPAVAALSTGTGRGGLLEIVIDGEVQGAGGLGGTSGVGGVGGTAIHIQQSGVILKGAGALRGGGGGGGKGGEGGDGVYYTARTETQGPYYSATQPLYRWWAYSPGHIAWNGTYITQELDPLTRTSYTSGGWTYRRGSLVDTNQYRVSRDRQVTDVPNYTSGGAGGNGGRGKGHDGANAAGSNGAAGGTNAGAGGKGGSGADWGATGSTGATGAAGNNGSGSAGSAGGLGGYYVLGTANLLLDAFTGTAQGRTS